VSDEDQFVSIEAGGIAVWTKPIGPRGLLRLRLALSPRHLTRVHGVEGVMPGRERHQGTSGAPALMPLDYWRPPCSGRSPRPAARCGVLLTPGALRWSPGHGAGVRFRLPPRPRPCPSSHGDAGAIPTGADAGATRVANSPASPFPPPIEGRRVVTQPAQSEGRWSVPASTAEGGLARIDVTLRGERFALAVLGGGAVAWLTTNTGDALAHLLLRAGGFVPLTNALCRGADGEWSVVRVAVFGDLVTLAIADDSPVSLTGEMSTVLGHLLLKVGTLASYARSAGS
jgi:hypothetical protein